MATQPSAAQYQLKPLLVQGFLLLSFAHLLAELYIYGRATIESCSNGPSGIVGHFIINLAGHLITYLVIAKHSKRYFLRLFPTCTYPRLMAHVNTILLTHGFVFLIAVFLEKVVGDRLFWFGKERWGDKVVEVVETVSVDAKDRATKSPRSAAAEAVKEAAAEAAEKVKEAVSKVVEEGEKFVNATKDEL